ncbi:hypothetical protein [uncultured Paludibaculum sp.]|uniref:hypothetical protein n=1 Tax=uncultured Paludibaculum sp. TaxID=1765020 RepID=UPI002AAAD24C|nr:hypothetical protein [uncultured Paludibaculum sp.]
MSVKLQMSRTALSLSLLDGAKWEVLRPLVQRWWSELKSWEAADTFAAAFQDDRMTVRQINVGSTARGGDFAIPNLYSSEKEHERTISLARDVAGVKERFTPANFYNPSTLKRAKNELGLHDLSASLLSHKKPIREQLKHYEDVVALFVPVPMEEDHALFYTLNQMGKNELSDGAHEIRIMRSQLTRIKLAQGSDMGTTYRDMSQPGSDQGKIRYGVTGTVIKRGEGQKSKASDATEQELKDRRSNALKYKRILNVIFNPGEKIVNEIVMAYRSHSAPQFPMFAQWDKPRRFFRLIDSDTLQPTGPVITNTGQYLTQAPPLPVLPPPGRSTGAFNGPPPPPPPPGGFK